MNKEDREQQETQPQQQKLSFTLAQSIKLVQSLLKDLIESEGEICQSIFNSQQIPSISLENYFFRIHKYTGFSPQCLFIAIIYLDKYNMAETAFSLNWYNVHRIILACLMLAAKFHDDVYFDNRTYERGGGVIASQLFLFQLQIFQKIDFNGYVDEDQYEDLVQRLHSVYVNLEESDTE